MQSVIIQNWKVIEMADSEYSIRVKRGHHSRLRFWFDPMNQKILDGDADLIYPDELSCDNICTHELFYPFIEKHFPGKFLFRNELNLMPLANVKEMVSEVRSCIDVLNAGDFDSPLLDIVREGIAIDLLVPEEEYDEKYFEASTQERQAAVLEHLDVVSAFYTKICDYLDEMLEKYEPQGFEYIAISAPS